MPRVPGIFDSDLLALAAARGTPLTTYEIPSGAQLLHIGAKSLNS
jgi:hypothetical protein